MAQPEVLDIEDLVVSDVSGQKVKRVKRIEPHSTVGELTRALLAQMQLPGNDHEGQPINYQPRLEREGRALHASELVGDALRTGDKLVLTPNIDAGGGR